ncbi:hypothetical protein [Pseudarthrobacter oxydans]|uniref:hypothetical protein n=1 Tax=Pseudarthrobacter oxydans TaxID=1671 RepID=UPI0034349BDB
MSLKPTKIYPFTIGAYEVLPLMVQGSYFKILSATGMVDVTGDTFGTVEALQAGQGLRGQDFGRLVVRDRSGGSNMVRLLIGDDQFIDDRISGEVVVIEGNKGRSIAGKAFTATTVFGAASAGNVNQVALYNPVGSGARLVVNNIVAGVSQGGQLLISTGQGVPLGVSSAPRKKDVSASAGNSVAVKYDAIATDAALGGTIVIALSLAAGQSMALPIQEPFIVREGRFMAVKTTVDSQDLIASMQFYEESVL